MGCCFKIEAEKVSCFENSGKLDSFSTKTKKTIDTPMDEYVAMNWSSDHKYIDYLSERYNRWVAGKGTLDSNKY